MKKVKFEIRMHERETASLDRPAWTSTEETGMFHAYRHKHTATGGTFKLEVDHFVEKN